MLNSDLSPADPQGGRNRPTDETRVVSTCRWVKTNCVCGRTMQPSIQSIVSNFFVPSDFIVGGQVNGLGAVHPHLALNFCSIWILPHHLVCFSFHILCSKPFGDETMDDGGWLRIDLAASNCCSARRRPWSNGR